MTVTAIDASNIEALSIDTDNLKFWETKSGGHKLASIGAVFALTGASFAAIASFVTIANARSIKVGGVITAVVGFATSFYFFSGKYYKDPKARAEYNEDIHKMSLSKFIKKYRWENIKTYGLAIPKTNSPLVTQEQMEEVFFKEATELESYMNFNYISLEGTCTLKKRGGKLWEYMADGMFTNQGIARLHQQFIKEFDEHEANFLFANLKELKRYDFNKDTQLKPLFEWLDKNDKLYQQSVENFKIKQEQLIKKRDQEIKIAKVKSHNVTEETLLLMGTLVNLLTGKKPVLEPNHHLTLQKIDIRSRKFNRTKTSIHKEFQIQLSKLVFEFHKNIGNLDRQYAKLKSANKA